MKILLTILQNNWVIGIGGGIISGIIVYFVTAWLMRRKDNTEYKKQIVQANTDVINSLKPYIPENGLPEIQIIQALISCTARKYGIKSQEMYSIKVFCEELISEMINNIYISGIKKHEYINNLNDYINHLPKETSEEAKFNIPTINSTRKESANQKIITLSLSMIAFLITIITVMLSIADHEPFYMNHISLNETSFILIIILSSILLIIMPLLLATTLSIIKRSKRIHEETERPNNVDNTTNTKDSK